MKTIAAAPVVPVCVLVLWAGICAAQIAEPNYDEARVPAYVLPDPLTMADGETVTDAAAWETRRREEIRELFREQMYGHSPGRPQEMSWEQFECDEHALGGKAIRKQVTVYFSRDKDGPSMDILINGDRSRPGPGA